MADRSPRRKNAERGVGGLSGPAIRPLLAREVVKLKASREAAKKTLAAQIKPLKDRLRNRR